MKAETAWDCAEIVLKAMRGDLVAPVGPQPLLIQARAFASDDRIGDGPFVVVVASDIVHGHPRSPASRG